MSTADAIDFLKLFRPGGDWVITSITPGPKLIESETFSAGQEAEMFTWIAARDGLTNLYFQVNSLLRPMRGKGAKAKKSDVKSLDWLHCDLDCRPTPPGVDVEAHFHAERERILALLRAYSPPPTIIIDSGGGYQGFWKLSEPVPVNGDVAVAEDLEHYNLQIEITLGGDCCHNLDRIMRLPGAWNVLDPKKIKKGRTRAQAKMVPPA